MARNAIGMAMATEEFGASFFANGAAPGGILEHPGTLKDPRPRLGKAGTSSFKAPAMQIRWLSSRKA